MITIQKFLIYEEQKECNNFYKRYLGINNFFSISELGLDPGYLCRR